MIAMLVGEVVDINGSSVTVLCGGVGYEVHVPISVVTRSCVVGQTTRLFTRQIVREDGWFLYGFDDVDNRMLFDLLREVKGCGPKISIAALGTLGYDTIVHALQTEDLKVLCRTPGIGTRLAERMVVELRDKVSELQFAKGHSGVAVVTREKAEQTDDPVIEALITLGYKRAEAEQAAAKARAEAQDEVEQIKLALKVLSG